MSQWLACCDLVSLQKIQYHRNNKSQTAIVPKGTFSYVWDIFICQAETHLLLRVTLFSVHYCGRQTNTDAVCCAGCTWNLRRLRLHTACSFQQVQTITAQPSLWTSDAVLSQPAALSFFSCAFNNSHAENNDFHTLAVSVLQTLMLQKTTLILFKPGKR